MPKTPKRPPRNACGRSDNDLRRCLFFVCPYRGRKRDASGPFQFSLCAAPCPLRLKNGPAPGLFRVRRGVSPEASDASVRGDAARRRDLHASSGWMTAGLATRSTARTRRAPAAQSGLQNQMCLGQHQAGVPVSGKCPGRGCKPAVAKAARRVRLERYQRFPPAHGSIAQLLIIPLSAGGLQVPAPSDSPIPTADLPTKEGEVRFLIPRPAFAPPEVSCRMV